MAIIANRVKTKNSILELIKFGLYIAKKYTILLLLALSLYLLYFTPPNFVKKGLHEFTGRIANIAYYAHHSISSTVITVYNNFAYLRDLEAENLQLKLNEVKLESLAEENRQLKKQNQSLSLLLHVVKNNKRNFVTAKLLGFSITPYSSYAIIGAGENQNIKLNSIVKGSKGLIGRVSEISDNYATVTLLNDNNSRIPVVTEKTRQKGILAKQGDVIKMLFMNEKHNSISRENIYTSGEGKIFPKGILVGRIFNEGRLEPNVELVENVNNLDYVVIEL